MCGQLEQSRIPLSLDHGDFFGGNIIIQEGVPIIYDWSDVTLSHPFLSATVFLEEVEQFFSSDSAQLLLKEYLSEWNEFEPIDRLMKEYDRIKWIAPIFHLTIYVTYIFPTFKDNWDKKQIIDGYIDKWVTNVNIL